MLQDLKKKVAQMAKEANPGELRTLIAIKNKTTTENENGYNEEIWTNIFGEDVYIGCKWINAHGQEVLTAQQMGLIEPATLTMRYTPLVKPTSLVFKHGDNEPFEILSLNNVQDKNKWLEIKVQRKVEAI